VHSGDLLVDAAEVRREDRRGDADGEHRYSVLMENSLGFFNE
jgi:hypothetical protein